MDKRHIGPGSRVRMQSGEIVQLFNGRTGLRFDTAEKLCRSIGLQIVIGLKQEPRTGLEQE
jgi:hypothetical protein